jgi:aconitate hydratase
MAAKDSFGAKDTLKAAGRDYTIYKLEALEKRGFALTRLPYSIKVLIENVLRREDGRIVTADQVEALAKWGKTGFDREFAFMPARVLLQDLTGVPVVADLAAMRDAMVRLGGDAA